MLTGDGYEMLSAEFTTGPGAHPGFPVKGLILLVMISLAWRLLEMRSELARGSSR
jgi:hypothetical protein